MRKSKKSEYYKTRCSICFRKIEKGDEKTLPCKHVFHLSCIKQFSLKAYPKNENIIHYDEHIKNQPIHLFRKGDNIMGCPYCGIECTICMCTYEMKRVLAKIHFKYDGNNVVHYITDLAEMILYVPLSGMCKDGYVNKKWSKKIHMFQHSWMVHGNLTLYPVKRTHPHIEFNFIVGLGPDTETSGMPVNVTGIISAGLTIRQIEFDELESLLNDK